MPHSLKRMPDYFTEETDALVNAAPSYPARMAFRIMLKTGLRVSEASALRRVDLRLDQHPPIIVIAADSPGNKGRKVPVLADLVESLGDLASSHSKNHYQPMLNLSRQQVGQVMKDAAREVGIDPPGPTPTLSGTPTAATAFCEAFRFPCCRNGWATPRWSTRRGMWSWPERITNGWLGCKPHMLATSPKLANPTTRVCHKNAHLLGGGGSCG